MYMVLKQCTMTTAQQTFPITILGTVWIQLFLVCFYDNNLVAQRPDLHHW